jgi:hypothetical protein
VLAVVVDVGTEQVSQSRGHATINWTETKHNVAGTPPHTSVGSLFPLHVGSGVVVATSEVASVEDLGTHESQVTGHRFCTVVSVQQRGASLPQ